VRSPPMVMVPAAAAVGVSETAMTPHYGRGAHPLDAS
jgi:hypothetical protein